MWKIKYLNTVLTLMLILLFLLCMFMVQMQKSLSGLNQSLGSLSASNNSIIQLNQKLETTISGLEGQIERFNKRFIKK